MTWTPSKHEYPKHGVPVGNATKTTWIRRKVVEARRTGQYANRWSCKLVCGHTTMTRSPHGGEPKLVRCQDCEAARKESP